MQASRLLTSAFDSILRTVVAGTPMVADDGPDALDVAQAMVPAQYLSPIGNHEIRWLVSGHHAQRSGAKNAAERAKDFELAGSQGWSAA